MKYATTLLIIALTNLTAFAGQSGLSKAIQNEKAQSSRKIASIERYHHEYCMNVSRRKRCSNITCKMMWTNANTRLMKEYQRNHGEHPPVDAEKCR